jgi:carbohydrate-selective porin OprB
MRELQGSGRRLLLPAAPVVGLSKSPYRGKGLAGLSPANNANTGIFKPASPADREQGGVSASRTLREGRYAEMPNRQRSGRRIRLGSHCARLLLALTPLGLVLLFFLAALSSARAGSDGGNPQTAWALPQSVPAYLYQLTDVGGLRSKLDRQGLSFIFSYFGDAFDNPFGGVKQGPGYDSRFAIIMDGDLEKLAGWSGAKVHASVHSIFSNQFSGANLDNLMLVSNVEAPPTVRLFNLWIEQSLTNRINLRVGQFTAAQEFIVSKNADLFINSPSAGRCSIPRICRAAVRTIRKPDSAPACK